MYGINTQLCKWFSSGGLFYCLNIGLTKSLQLLSGSRFSRLMLIVGNEKGFGVSTFNVRDIMLFQIWQLEQVPDGTQACGISFTND